MLKSIYVYIVVCSQYAPIRVYEYFTLDVLVNAIIYMWIDYEVVLYLEFSLLYVQPTSVEALITHV